MERLPECPSFPGGEWLPECPSFPGGEWQPECPSFPGGEWQPWVLTTGRWSEEFERAIPPEYVTRLFVKRERDGAEKWYQVPVTVGLDEIELCRRRNGGNPRKLAEIIAFKLDVAIASMRDKLRADGFDA